MSIREVTVTDPDDVTLRVDVRTRQGVYTSTFSWATPELKAEHEQAAIRTACEATAAVIRESGDVRRARAFRTRFGTLFVHVNTGPPTWWLPKVKAGRRTDGTLEVMAGWLRALVAVSWNRHDR